MAFREIRRNLLRSSLTALGVIIGVAAVIAMVTLGEGASAQVTDEVASMGENLLIVRPGARMMGGASTSAAPFSAADLDAIAEVRGVEDLAPVVSRAVRVVYANKNWSTTVTGTTASYLDVRGSRLETGESFLPSQERTGTAVCVIGATVVRELFGAGDPLGATIRVDNVPCEVIGVVEARGESTFGMDQDDFVLMPIAAVQRRIVGNDDIGVVLVTASRASGTPEVQEDIVALLRERRGIRGDDENDFEVRDLKEVSQMLDTITGVLTALLGSIAAVSLLVGGIGIMNIMLVSVTERTREIGIRLAIGARAREVLFQFLVEAVLLSTFGGLLGVALGLAGAYAAARALGIVFVLAPEIIVIAFAFSAAVGVVFGFFPARKAARMNPIDALRHE
jgi:putative ABC transport system permease protein